MKPELGKEVSRVREKEDYWGRFLRYAEEKFGLDKDTVYEALTKGIASMMQLNELHAVYDVLSSFLEEVLSEEFSPVRFRVSLNVIDVFEYSLMELEINCFIDKYLIELLRAEFKHFRFLYGKNEEENIEEFNETIKEIINETKNELEKLRKALKKALEEKHF